jgi:hypothetical protein
MKLCRSQNDRVIAGVCGGLEEHPGRPPSRLRDLMPEADAILAIIVSSAKTARALGRA